MSIPRFREDRLGPDGVLRDQVAVVELDQQLLNLPTLFKVL